MLRLGYRRFEVFLNAMEELSSPFLRGLGERARAYGASFVSVHPFTSAAESTLLFGDYPRRTREGFDFYRRYLAAAAQLGARWVVIHGQPQGHGALSDEGYWRRFGELYQLGKEEGAFPAQENVRQHRSARPEFIAGMARYLGEDCAFVLDVKQCRMAGARVEDMVGAMGPRLVHVHLSDAAPGRPCLLPGAGEEDPAPGLLAPAGPGGLCRNPGDRGVPPQLWGGGGAGGLAGIHKKRGGRGLFPDKFLAFERFFRAIIVETSRKGLGQALSGPQSTRRCSHVKCPYCGFVESRVIDSRPTDEGERIRRRRECLKCGKRFTTYEVIENVPIVVIKKDKSRETFDRSKLLNGLLRACEKRPVSMDTLERIVDEIECLLQNSLDREVSSQRIGTYAMEKLKNVDEVAYVRFASVYRQFKDINSFMEELSKIINTKKDS